jgi:hypothetical protein
VAPAGVTGPRHTTRCEEQPEKKPGNQSAHVGGHADLRRRKIECNLDCYDQADVCEPLFREWRVTMSQ